MTSANAPSRTNAAQATVTRSEEQLRPAVTRVPVERVRLTRRIVTETRHIEVEVRREELHVERTPLDPTAATPSAAAAARPTGLVILLSEEVPVVTMAVRPVERVVVSVHDVPGEQTVTAEVRSERVEVTGAAPASTG